MARNILKRIEKVEKAAKSQGRFAPTCICFPEKEYPSFHWPIEFQTAMTLKCPLHGDRFKPRGLVYVSRWQRQKREYLIGKRGSAQFRKAWEAGFPPALWPGKEEEIEDGRIFLNLRDGTRFLAYEPQYKIA